MTFLHLLLICLVLAVLFHFLKGSFPADQSWVALIDALLKAAVVMFFIVWIFREVGSGGFDLR